MYIYIYIYIYVYIYTCSVDVLQRDTARTCKKAVQCVVLQRVTRKQAVLVMYTIHMHM